MQGSFRECSNKEAGTDEKIWLHTCVNEGPEPGASVYRSAGIRHTEGKYLPGPDVGAGFSAAPVSAADESAEEGGSAGGQEHWPAGAQLRWDPGAVEKYYQGDRGAYPGDRYAAAEYGFGPGRPDGGIYFRSGATNSGLCGGDRTGIYQAASGGRDCGGEGEGSPVWLPEDGKPP